MTGPREWFPTERRDIAHAREQHAANAHYTAVACGSSDQGEHRSRRAVLMALTVIARLHQCSELPARGPTASVVPSSMTRSDSLSRHRASASRARRPGWASGSAASRRPPRSHGPSIQSAAPGDAEKRKGRPLDCRRPFPALPGRAVFTGEPAPASPRRWCPRSTSRPSCRRRSWPGHRCRTNAGRWSRSSAGALRQNSPTWAGSRTRCRC